MVLLRHHNGHSSLLNNPTAVIIGDIIIIFCMIFSFVMLVLFCYFMFKYILPEILEIESRKKNSKK